MAVDWARCGRSVGLPNACGRRDVDEVRTTAGEAGAAADMAKPRKEQQLAYLPRRRYGLRGRIWWSAEFRDAVRLVKCDQAQLGAGDAFSVDEVELWRLLAR